MSLVRTLTVMSTLVLCNAAFAGTTTVFSYPNGFASAESSFNPVSDAAGWDNGIMEPTTSAPGMHEAGAVWYKTLVDVSSFTTSFTFKMADTGTIPSIIGMTFCIQNSNSTTNPETTYGLNYGINAGADANVSGYGDYSTQDVAIGNSVAVKFDIASNSASEVTYPMGGAPSGSGLYIDGGPLAGLFPQIDLNPANINLNVGHTMAATFVYDGSLLVMTLTDTQTNAQFRTSWPIDIPTVVGANTAFIGFTAGEIPAEVNQILGWTYATGMNTRLATPTFSVAEGSYADAQTVTIDGPSGATLYYSTDGMDPTTSSMKYTAPISVSASTVVKAVAIENGSTDSLVGTANYRIAPAGSPYIDFSSGFANAAGLVTHVGTTILNGTSLRLTDSNSNGNEVGAAWYVTPVDVTKFTTSFRLQWTSANGMGMTFVIQNQNPTSTDKTSKWVSGGPFAMGNETGLGYSGTTGQYGQVAGLNTSVALVFDINHDNGDDTGLYTNGADVTGSAIDMTSSGMKLKSGNPIDVTLTYDGTTLHMTATDSVTNATFTHDFTIDIPATVMGNTAYVGFTGSTYYNVDANQDILSWTYEPMGVVDTSDGGTTEEDGGIVDNDDGGVVVNDDGSTASTAKKSSGCGCDVGAGSHDVPPLAALLCALCVLLRYAYRRS